ncbi:MAG: D-aminoacyl-tRNA deacylase [Nanoarchaeota archaeon]|nr:D-aminoacyl-tRNA deacylase [Nanoarchaeota archaeon]
MAKYAIIISKKDSASVNIGKNLLELFDFKNNSRSLSLGNVALYEIEEESIYCNNLNIEEDIIIFASKHKSSSGKPSLSVHVPGNWAKAELGGRNKILDIAPASLMKDLFIELNKQGKGFEGEITLEATHHGPATRKPVLFIEIGSSEVQWKNEKYGQIIARTIMNVLLRKRKKYQTAFAIGGGHYPREFNKFLLRTDLAIGHICPKYALNHLDIGMVKQALEKTFEPVDFILLDWKGLGPYKEKVKNIVYNLNIPVKRVDKILKSLKKS